jgi:hypothetical protein
LIIAIGETKGAFQSQNLPAQPKPEEEESPKDSGLVNIMIGSFTGLCSGLLGIGGGIVIIPLLKRFSGFSMKSAIPASSATMLITAGIGALYKNIQLPNLKAPDGNALEISTSLMIAACLIPTAFVGSYIGASMMHALPMKVIKRSFAVLLIIAAARMGYTAWTGIQQNQNPTAESTSLPASEVALLSPISLEPTQSREESHRPDLPHRF